MLWGVARDWQLHAPMVAPSAQPWAQAAPSHPPAGRGGVADEEVLLALVGWHCSPGVLPLSGDTTHGESLSP